MKQSFKKTLAPTEADTAVSSATITAFSVREEILLDENETPSKNVDPALKWATHAAVLGVANGIEYSKIPLRKKFRVGPLPPNGPSPVVSSTTRCRPLVPPISNLSKTLYPALSSRVSRSPTQSLI